MGNGGGGAGLGARRGSYAIAGVGGVLGQMGRRFLVGLYAFAVVVLIVKRPPSAFTKGAVMGAVILGLFLLRLGWLRVSTKFEIRRCHLHAGGVAVTNYLGGPYDAVAWSEVTQVKQSVSVSPLMAFHRIELDRRGSAPLAFVALGQNPAVVDALLSQAKKNGVLR